MEYLASPIYLYWYVQCQRIALSLKKEDLTSKRSRGAKPAQPSSQKGKGNQSKSQEDDQFGTDPLPLCKLALLRALKKH